MKTILSSLYWKLALAFMLVAFLTAALLAVFIRATSNDRLFDLVIDQQRSVMVEALTGYYNQIGSWDGVAENWRLIERFAAFSEAGHMPETPFAGQMPMMAGGGRSLFGLADSAGRVIVPVDVKYPQGSALPRQILRGGTEISVNGETVGTVITVDRFPHYNQAEARFIQRTSQGLVYAGLGALAAALLLAILLSSGLTRPLLELTNAAKAMSRGQLDQQVAVRGDDEIGQLAGAFNQMSAEVTRANRLRRQMTADIAHDLRTPLTVIAGYIEAMRDGVLQPTQQRLALIYSETERLQSLVGDLRMLSQADAGELRLNPQSIAPGGLLERTAELFQHHAEQQNVTLVVDAPPGLPEIRVDEARLMQVMDNLLSNALRYTPAGGQVTLSARAAGEQGVELAVSDTGSGIAPEELPLIFDRFHRVDTSRHTDTGGSGLGLAIVRALVEANGGRVWAESQPGAGTTIRLVFVNGKNLSNSNTI